MKGPSATEQNMSQQKPQENITSDNDLDELEGSVDFISFQSKDTGYTVLKVKPIEGGDDVTVVGEMPGIHSDQKLLFRGKWFSHPKYGRQFRALSYEQVLPSTVRGLEQYLASGFIKGVGPVTAERIIKHFGEDIITVLEEQPERLLEVALIGPRKQDQIVKSWQEHRGIQPVVMFLQQHTIPMSFASKLYQEYGTETISMLKSRPYDLTNLWGIGFQTADQMARRLSESNGLWDAGNLERLKAGLRHALKEATREGHLYLPLEQLLDHGAELLAVTPESLVEALEGLLQIRELVAEPRPGTDKNYDIYLNLFWHAEQQCAERLQTLLAEVEAPETETLQQWLTNYQDEHELVFSPEQHLAVETAASNKVFILTGGPGTGKTTISRAILNWFQAEGDKVLLASPTGRAAKRLSELTGKEAKTIHRLLEYDPHNNIFNKDQHEPLVCDVLLVDEISMVDTQLFSQLLRALPDKARLILIGDADQLPSVGAGSVLKDLLQSQVIPAVQLKTIFRQAQLSRIVLNAHQVNQGQTPTLLPPTGSNRKEDAFFVQTHSPEETVQQIIDLMARRLPAAGYAPENIQVLCPMKRGIVGTQSLNQALQAVLNPKQQDKIEFQQVHRSFRQGDRVMQLRNNYDQDVFNGDLGEVVSINNRDRELGVQFSDKEVTYPAEQLKELDFAYAMTIHKSQGSEFPVVILALTNQHYIMLQRNLLYTAMTRARQLLVIVGQQSAIERSVANEQTRQRFTHLSERLQNLVAQEMQESFVIPSIPSLST